jgi:hypothetical protein
MAARNVASGLAPVTAGGAAMDLAFGRRGTVCWVLLMTLGTLPARAFLKRKSHQPIIRHGDRAYNAAEV